MAYRRTVSDVPVLTDPEIASLLTIPKAIEDPDWKQSLLPPAISDYDLRGRYDLEDLPENGPLRGRLHLYSRQNLNPNVSGDWSVGLIYTDYADRSFRLLRCNGPHPTDHVNAIEGDVIIRTPHVHCLTERYQRRRRARPDGYAEPTDAYDSIESAIVYLAKRVSLQPSGILFL